MSERQHIRAKNGSSAAAQRRARSLLRIWLSPSFPTGAYAYSHGLEKAVDSGLIVDRITLVSWLSDLIEIGSLPNDLILLASAWRATETGNSRLLVETASLGAALQPSGERELEAVQQGTSFLQQIEAAWPYSGEGWGALAGDVPAVYPVAVGFATSRHAIPLPDVLDTYGVAFVSNLASASIRLSIIGQTDAQHVIANLLSLIEAASDKASRSSLVDLGSAVWISDLASLQHETQHTRLFRS